MSLRDIFGPMWNVRQQRKFGRQGWVVTFVIWFAGLAHAAPATQPAVAPDDKSFTVGEVLASDDFAAGTDLWATELEAGGSVQMRDGALDIDVPAGCTIWLKQPLNGPVMIEYEATAIAAGGKNDRVSDLNCFWMARDTRSPDDIFGTKRSGKFADYNPLTCYYAGLGGNRNTTTRFRRYIGDKTERPLRPEHDLMGKEFLLTANASQRIRLVALGGLIQLYRDERKLFELDDAEPYRSGWFAFRTTKSHLQIRHFRVYRIASK